MGLTQVLVVVVVLAVVASACGNDVGEDSGVATGTAPTTTAAPTSVPTTLAPTTSFPEEDAVAATLALTDYPFWENPVSVEAQEALDALTAAYVAGLDEGAEPEVERFLFGSLPVTVFDEIFGGVDAGRQVELMWLLHLSGYFGGRWLRGEIAAAQPDALLVGFSVPPTEEAFVETMTRAQARLDALDGDDASIVAAARAALFDTPPSEEGGDPKRGLTDSFGYNRGYMLEILATPPEGVAASPRYEVTCGGLLDCVYASPKLAVLPELGGLQAALNSDAPPDPDLVAELIPIQEAAIPRGTAVWSGGLSVQGFSQQSYDQLLDVSSSFLETVQATALVNVRAAADDDVAAARTGLIAEAAQIVWLEAYIAGLTNGEGEIELPAFG